VVIQTIEYAPCDHHPRAVAGISAGNLPDDWQWLRYPDGREMLVSSAGVVMHSSDNLLDIKPGCRPILESSARLLTQCREVYRSLDGIMAGDLAALRVRIGALIQEIELQAELESFP